MQSELEKVAWFHYFAVVNKLTVKRKVKILQNFVAFSEYTNFI